MDVSMVSLMDGSFIQAIDHEPWLTLAAWADQLEEKGLTKERHVVRWLIDMRRIPSQHFGKCPKIDPIRYYWSPLYMPETATAEQVKSSTLYSKCRSHCLPVWSPYRKLIRKKYSTMSLAYRVAVLSLRAYASKLI